MSGDNAAGYEGLCIYRITLTRVEKERDEHTSEMLHELFKYFYKSLSPRYSYSTHLTICHGPCTCVARFCRADWLSSLACKGEKVYYQQGIHQKLMMFVLPLQGHQRDGGWLASQWKSSKFGQLTTHSPGLSVLRLPSRSGLEP